jgi:NAD(P)-dependent dehydrogenase (short-subunit alcohol dehydrogenase family)
MTGGLFGLDGHVALVTGGNGGIGLGFARGLAASGAALAIWGTNAAKNARAAAELEALGATVFTAVCDVADADAVRDTMKRTVAELGRVDSCFLSAGVGAGAPSFLGTTDDEWHRVTRVNLDGAFYCAREVVRHMVERFGDGDDRGGSLVFVSSGAVFSGQQKGQNYAASKAGLIGMMKGIAVEHARHGVRANVIMPGWVESDMTESWFANEKFAGNVIPRIPLRRWGTPDDFAGLAVYLAGPASRYHTADVLTVDGGYHSF